MMTTIVAESGQVTIPKALREKMGIRPSTVLNFSIKNNTLSAVKVPQDDPVSTVLGCLKDSRGTNGWMTELRGKP